MKSFVKHCLIDLPFNLLDFYNLLDLYSAFSTKRDQRRSLHVQKRDISQGRHIEIGGTCWWIGTQDWKYLFWNRIGTLLKKKD